MINVLIHGINGRMGQEVLKQIEKSDIFNFSCGIDKDDNIEKISNIPDVIIDFSIPQASMNMLEFAAKNNIPVVIATTGFSKEQISMINKYSEVIPIFKSANMSYEINIMSDLVSKLAILLKDSDIEIIETHHNKKIDSPSGTALILADSINNALGNTLEYEYNRHDKHEARSKSEIGIHSIRGGTEVGKHTVMFFGENESLEITHNVTSRSIFAKGALKASEFIVTKQTGLYDMKDLINN